MQETLAAAVLLAAGWKGDGNLVNPMCGSGTLAIEGALIAARRPPGSLRDNFGFMHIQGLRTQDLVGSAPPGREDPEGEERRPAEIIATDISSKAVEGARKNAAAAGVADRIEFQVCDYAETPVPEGGGVVLLNPGIRRAGGPGRKARPRSIRESVISSKRNARGIGASCLRAIPTWPRKSG